MSHDESPVNRSLFVPLRAKAGKEAEVEAFLRDGLSAVMEEHDTTTWYAVRFGHDDFAMRQRGMDLLADLIEKYHPPPQFA
jgi:hypothetical protein